MEALRLYVEGYNLLTFSAVSKYNIDPESPAVNNGYYPQQRTYTLGDMYVRFGGRFGETYGSNVVRRSEPSLRF